MTQRRDKLIEEIQAIRDFYRAHGMLPNSNGKETPVTLYAEDYDYLVSLGAVANDRLEDQILVKRGEPKRKRYSKRPPSAPGQI